MMVAISIKATKNSKTNNTGSKCEHGHIGVVHALTHNHIVPLYAKRDEVCHVIESDGMHIWDLAQTAAHAVRLITEHRRAPCNHQSVILKLRSLIEFPVPWRT